MGLWSIQAAKKQEQVPGSSRWVLEELHHLHETMFQDVEQFTYSVASEITWAHEALDEVLNDDEKNPRLLLESPKKLRGTESPVKKMREHALLLKSPLKDKTNIALSPIKYNRKSPQGKDQSPMKLINLTNLGSNTMLKPTVEESDWLRKSNSPFLNKVKEQSHKSSMGLESSPSLEHLHQNTPSRGSSKTLEKGLYHTSTDTLKESYQDKDHDKNDHETHVEENEYEEFEKVEVESQEQPIKEPTREFKKDNFPKEPVKLFEFEQQDEPAKSSIDERLSDDDNDYDASMEDHSFQAIRKSIRRSILRKSKASEEISTDISFKDVQNAEPQQSSLVVNQGSIETSRADSKDAPNNKFTNSEPGSFTKSNTPPPQLLQPQPQQRKSQGFALLPHRDPLTVKSAKKSKPTSNEGQRKSSEEQKSLGSPQEKLSPLVFKGLYPTISPQKAPQLGSSPSKISKPKLQDTQEKSPSKPSTNLRKANMQLKSTKPLIHSPPNDKIVDSSKTSTNSPLSNIFASVGSTLRKARNRFTKDHKAEKSKVNDEFKVSKPRKSSTGSPKLPNGSNNHDVSPSKRVISNSESVLSRLTAPTEASQAKSAAKDGNESPIKPNDDDFSSKLSPVKFSYEPLRYELNKSVQKSPTKSIKSPSKSPIKFASKSPTKSPVKNQKQELKSKVDEPMEREQNRKSHGSKPKNLTRISLTKPKGDNPKSINLTRKSLGKGLTNIALNSSNKSINKASQRSLSGDNQPVKRKTQSEDEIKTTTIQYQQPQPKKLITKILAPSSVQNQEPEVKRRRTSDEARMVFKKRPSRISNTNEQTDSRQQTLPPQPQKSTQPSYDQKSLNQQTSRIIPNNAKHSKYGQAANTQNLMRTAVLQHAKETNKSNPFQNGSINKMANNHQPIPVTPKTPTVLPEIFSESEDDDEGVVLKDWANTPELRDKLMKQRRIDPDQVFGPMAPLQMEDIFKNSRLSRFKHRGSSAQWVGQDALTMQEVASYKSKTYKKL